MSVAFTRIADIRIRWFFPSNTEHYRRDFHGFAEEDNGESYDLTINVNLIEGDSSLEDLSTTTIAQCTGVNKDLNEVAHPFEWIITKTNDGCEHFTISFDEHPFVNKARIDWLINDNKASLTICTLPKYDKSKCDFLILPLFNIFLSRFLIRQNAILVHSSVISQNDLGVLFTAVSGTGKSTMARIWKDDGARIINDDMNILRIKAETDEVYAYNIPMPYYNDEPKCCILTDIIFISQATNNWIETLPLPIGAIRLMSNSIHQTFDKETTKQFVSLYTKIANHVRLHTCGFLPDRRIIETIKNAVK